ncbi:hypothetical protein ATY75_24090 [Rhizobium sp. N122]|nr:hypothetical protein ATY75_24090 [Rhizobium sp. N122]
METPCVADASIAAAAALAQRLSNPQFGERLAAGTALTSKAQIAAGGANVEAFKRFVAVGIPTATKSWQIGRTQAPTVIFET